MKEGFFFLDLSFGPKRIDLLNWQCPKNQSRRNNPKVAQKHPKLSDKEPKKDEYENLLVWHKPVKRVIRLIIELQEKERNPREHVLFVFVQCTFFIHPIFRETETFKLSTYAPKIAKLYITWNFTKQVVKLALFSSYQLFFSRVIILNLKLNSCLI